MRPAKHPLEDCGIECAHDIAGTRDCGCPCHSTRPASDTPEDPETR